MVLTTHGFFCISSFTVAFCKRSNASVAKPGSLHVQQGFFLLEIMIAVLLFSVSLLGLSQYHHVLLQTFHYHWQERLAWSLAHQYLDIFFINHSINADVITLQSGWQQKITSGEVHAYCRQIIAVVITPQNQQAELSRWHCS